MSVSSYPLPGDVGQKISVTGVRVGLGGQEGCGVTLVCRARVKGPKSLLDYRRAELEQNWECEVILRQARVKLEVQH